MALRVVIPENESVTFVNLLRGSKSERNLEGVTFRDGKQHAALMSR